MSKPFEIQPYRSIDKWIEVTGPANLSFRVDYDDVDQKQTRKLLEKAVKLLNFYWDNPESDPLLPDGTERHP